MKEATLGELCEIHVGRTPARAAPAFWGVGHKWLSIADMKQGLAIINTKEQITDAGARAGKVVQPGTVLLSFKLSIGKVGIAEVPLFTNEAIAALPVKDERVLDQRYLMRALEAMDLSERSNRAAMGATLNKTSLAQIRIPLPPISQQRRTAAILDRADALRAKRNLVIARLDSLAQSILQEVLTDSTETVRLGELADWRAGGTPPRGEREYFEGQVPWFSSGELGPVYVGDSREHLSESALEKTSAKLIPSGSILLGMYDTAALKSSITTKQASCNQAVAFGTIFPAVAETLFVYWATQAVKPQVLSLRRGIRQKNLNLSMIRDIEIPHAPLSAQREFAKRVEQVNTHRAAAQHALAAHDELFACLQSCAFRGEL